MFLLQQLKWVPDLETNISFLQLLQIQLSYIQQELTPKVNYCGVAKPKNVQKLKSRNKSTFTDQLSCILHFYNKMYQDYKGYSYYDKTLLNGVAKRPLSTYSNLNVQTDKYSNQKSLRWNIEESKENASFSKTYDYANKYTLNSPFQSTEYQSNYLTPRKQRKNDLEVYSKTLGTKSFKNIKHSSQFEHSYQLNKSYGNLTNDFKSYQPRNGDLKGLAMSMGYKSTLKDLIPRLTAEENKYEDKKNQTEEKTLKSCISQKKLISDLVHTYEETPQISIKIQLAGSSNKSSKKLANYLANQPRSKSKQIQELLSTSYNKTQNSELKTRHVKTLSYREKLNTEYQLEKSKRHLTAQNQKPKESFSSKSGLSISSFQLGPCKGEGAFGQVFLAIHKPTRMLVAIKKIPKEKVKYMLDQFINEIKIQMFLDHPNIVKLYAFFDDSTHFYIVMEYMEGGSLFSYIKKKKKLTPQETATRLKQVCLGLKQMHDNSILHRDIKPENIVITNDVCKLCDFGWSAVCKDRRTTYCGTLDYISPEIAGGEGYDDSVDIWCIGVLAYELICGKTPFYNISRAQTMKKIMNVKYQYPPELTPKAKSFIDKILKKNPEDRLGIEQVLKDDFLAQ